MMNDDDNTMTNFIHHPTILHILRCGAGLAGCTGVTYIGRKIDDKQLVNFGDLGKFICAVGFIIYFP